MSKRTIRTVQAGRPKGATTYDRVVAEAFGTAIRTARLAQGLSQEEFAARAGIERSHVGKIERGQHMPTLVALFKLAHGLELTAYELVAEAEVVLPKGYVPGQGNPSAASS